ncbi:MAG: pyruvate kinase [Patescibacteria group bacterium]
MHKLTKIVATIGPSSDTEEMIEKLIHAGVNVFRFNFKHNTVESHKEGMKRVQMVSERMNVSVGILLDLQGPEIRINMPYEQIEITKGQELLFDEESLEKKEIGFSISHSEILKYINDGQRLVADDGAFTFKVHKREGKLYIESENTGVLKKQKSLNIPGADFPFPVLMERDKIGLDLITENCASYVALSFVRSAEDLKVIREEMKKRKCKAKLIAKIETQRALDDLDAIIEETDGVMVARGDLGVELPIEQVPYYQKLLIKKCIEKGKSVITATQMLQSMVVNPYPTRAEVSDVANACYDLTDAVMLSAESASGLYPLQSVEMMSKTILFNETKLAFDVRTKYELKTQRVNNVIADAAYNIYLQLMEHNENLAGFVVFTHSGKTAELVSKYRPQIPIFTFAPSQEICNHLSLLFGIFSYIRTENPRNEISKDDILQGISFLENYHSIKKGDRLIILHGDHWAEGVTSTVKVVTV